MSDAKLDPKSFSVEERAMIDILVAARMPKRDGSTIAWCYEQVLLCEGGAAILARRAIFGVAESEGAKAETTADRIAADLKAGTFRGVQPEPAAPSEMPEAVHPVARAVDALITASEYYEDEESIAVCVQAAEDLESFWRTHSQPAPVRMTEELKRVFAAAFKRACDFHAPTGEAQQINQDIAAVRAQAAEVVKLPKVPVADIQWALNIAASKAVTMSALEACQRIKKFLAEIDAAECRAETKEDKS